MERKEILKAAKDLNAKAGTKIKVVAINVTDLTKQVKEAVSGLVEFDFSSLEPETLQVLDDLNCKTSDVAEVLDEVADEEIQEDLVDEVEIEDAKFLESEALIEAAKDLADVLAYDETAITKFEKLDVKKMVVELQKMADEINQPYEDEKGKRIIPNDKPELFHADTLEVFKANNIKVKWNEEEKEAEKKPAKKASPAKAKVQDKKNEPKPKISKATEKGKGTTKIESTKPAAKKKETKPKVVKAGKPVKKEKKYTRINAFCDVMRDKKPHTKAEINDLMNEKYGGDPRDQSGNITFMITPLIEFGLVDVKGEGKSTTYQLK